MDISTSDARCLDYNELQHEFGIALAAAFEKRDAQILRQAFDSFKLNSDHDKKSPLDHAFREMLLYQFYDNVENVGELIKLSVEAVRAEIVSVTIPVVLLADIFDTVTLDKCEQIFSYVEEMVEVWKEEKFFSSCKNNILRMCNDLLRRLSRAQNTVFCGRILLFLSKFFPFSERSGLNIVSEFNVDNVTEYGVDGKDLDDALEDTVEDITIKIDYNLYCKFWSLQDFFRNPNQCYSKAQWKMFQLHATTVLDSFASFVLEEPRISSNLTGTTKKELNENMEVDDESPKSSNKSANVEQEIRQTVSNAEYFFAKFLTNPKLLALQLSDSNFRRSILVQFLILFQYLQMPVKFKTDANILTSAQTDFIKETETTVYKLLEETPPNGKRFSRTVKHMLEREVMWNNWKNEGCKDFKKPHELEVTSEEISKEGVAGVHPKPPPAKRPRRPLGDCLRDATRQGKFYLGNDVLTRLWNYMPDNLSACRSEARNFLPQLETFLESPHERGDPSYEWRALRLLARQSPHFFTFVNTPSYKTCDYLESIRRKLARDKIESTTKQSGNSIINNGTNNEASSSIESEDHENEPEAGDELDEEAETADLEKVEEETHAHTKPITATREHIEEIAPLIGDHWKRLGKKLGFTADEILYFETENITTRDGPCIAMLVNWFAEDDDASLDNWAYILEGLEINAAAKAVKSLIERLSNVRQEPEDVDPVSD